MLELRIPCRSEGNVEYANIIFHMTRFPLFFRSDYIE